MFNYTKSGCCFFSIGRKHVGILISVNGDTITIQEGNLDGKTNTFKEAQKGWRTTTYTFNQFKLICKGVVFANPK